MLPVARLGDIGQGTCTAHPPNIHYTTGKIITSQSNVMINGLPCARMTDMVVTDCGGVGIIISGSTNILVQGLPIATMLSTFVGTFTGTIIGGSGNVLA